jgi:hypothetical protein
MTSQLQALWHLEILSYNLGRDTDYSKVFRDLPRSLNSSCGEERKNKPISHPFLNHRS